MIDDAFQTLDVNKTLVETPAEPTLLANRYRVVRQLGQGGMGSVWLAEDTKLDNRLVAIKMLPSVLVTNKRAYAQVKQEALVSLKLSHPNIVTVRAFEEEGGSPFLVMDYIDGQSLDDYLGERGKLTEAETVALLGPVADALDYAHGEGVVHRDVKPGNVMIAKGGKPYVLDFGIAREIQETMTRVTGKNSSGTLLYMSPEQLKGAAPKPKQDVYSFAAMAYECLVGRTPFSRGNVEYQIVNEPPEPLDPSVGIARQVMAGLAKTADGRPATCRAVLTLATGGRDEGPVVPKQTERAAKSEDQGSRKAAPPAENPPSAVQASKTRRNVVLAVVGLVLAVGAGWLLRTPPAPSDEAVVKPGRDGVPSPSAAGDGTPDLPKEGGVQLWKDGPYWAECNVGATKPEESGYYFRWGDTVGYRHVGDQWQAVDGSWRGFEFSKGNCPTYGKEINQLRAEGYIDESGNLVARHDAATAHLGASWRMPTIEEFDALDKNCTSAWTQRNGVPGRIVTGKGDYASKSIFLPAAGSGRDSRLYNTGSLGLYWSSTPGSDYSIDAWSLYFDSSNYYRNNYSRYYGRSVRPLRGFAK